MKHLFLKLTTIICLLASMSLSFLYGIKKTTPHTKTPPSSPSKFFVSSSLMKMTPIETMSAAVSEALGEKVELVSIPGGSGPSGGGGATTSIVKNKRTEKKYFVKSARNKYSMLMAEYVGVQTMADTETIQVPTPIACGEHKETRQAFCIFEYLEFQSGGNQFELGVKLAKVNIVRADLY